MQNIQKNNYFSGEDHLSFESYVQNIKPTNQNVSFSYSDNKADRKVFSGGVALREEIAQA